MARRSASLRSCIWETTFLMTNSSRRIDHTFTSKITEEPLEYDLKLPKNHWNDIKSPVKSAGIRSKISEENTGVRHACLIYFTEFVNFQNACAIIISRNN